MALEGFKFFFFNQLTQESLILKSTFTTIIQSYIIKLHVSVL